MTTSQFEYGRQFNTGAVATERRFFRDLNDLHPNLPLSRARKTKRGPLGGKSKRLFDILVALVLIIALLPTLLIISLLIKLTSKGPVFFLQRRGGYRRRPFLIYKFRTMTTLDDGSRITHAVEGDQRVTQIGQFLRSTSLDELPQLLNVLKGEMSLIGPRPHALAHDAKFSRISKAYAHRFKARPGITGLAQVSGCRGPVESNEDVRRRALFDARYVKSWKFFNDIAILFKTFRTVLSKHNAV